MQVGYSHQGQCFATVEAARTNLCESAYPQTSGSVVVSCTGVTSTGIQVHRAEVGASGVDQELTTTHAPCYVGAIGAGPITPAQALDAFSWGFVAVLLCYLVAWGAGRVLAAIGWR